MKIFLIGTGNIAWTIGEKLHEHHHRLHGIYGRDRSKAAALAQRWGCEACCEWQAIPDDADCYLFTLQDHAYDEILPLFPFRGKIMLHTSGTLPVSLFDPLTPHGGVLYPFQTCTKGESLSTERLPLCLEATDGETAEILDKTAGQISEEQYWMNSGQRQQLHLAGVFANNFSNMLYRIAFEITDQAGLSNRILQGLIQETAQKVARMTPAAAQTGPAKRNDENIIQKHLSLLEGHPQWKELYQLMTELIQQS